MKIKNIGWEKMRYTKEHDFPYVPPILADVVPNVSPRRKSDQPVWKLSPDLVREFQLIRGEHDNVIIHGQDSFSGDFFKRVKPVGK